MAINISYVESGARVGLGLPTARMTRIVNAQFTNFVLLRTSPQGDLCALAKDFADTLSYPSVLDKPSLHYEFLRGLLLGKLVDDSLVLREKSVFV